MRLKVIFGTLGQVSNGVSVGQMFGALRDKASAKQSTFARAELTGADLFVPLGVSLGHVIPPPFCRRR